MMAIARLDPFREFATLQDRMNRMFGDVYLRDEGGVTYPKILDFGISRSIDPASGGRASQATREGVIVGTPSPWNIMIAGQPAAGASPSGRSRAASIRTPSSIVSDSSLP